MPSLTANLAYLTEDIPGIGGLIRQRPPDFLVEEQPLYEPAGEGEYIYLYVEKTHMTTLDVVRRIAKAYGVNRRDVGYAGLKDKRAVTWQHFSVYRPDTSRDDRAVDHISYHPNLRVHWTSRHHNKLRRGHHGGNRFIIRIRDVRPNQVLTAHQVLKQLESSGMPNFVGEQRFGYRQNGHLLGRLLLLGHYEAFIDHLLGQPGNNDIGPLIEGRAAFLRKDFGTALQHWPRKLRFDRQALDALRQGKTPEQAACSIDRTQWQLLLSAWQSVVFNTVLNRRMEQGTLNQLVPGDLAWKHDSRAVFAVDEQTAAIENAASGRVRTLGVSPSGPMWGPQMPRCSGDVDRQELAAMAEQAVDLEQVNGTDVASPSGSRRPLRVPLRNVDLEAGVDEHGEYVRVAFELPRGAFATTALREIMKNDRRPTPEPQ